MDEGPTVLVMLDLRLGHFKVSKHTLCYGNSTWLVGFRFKWQAAMGVRKKQQRCLGCRRIVPLTNRKLRPFLVACQARGVESRGCN